MAWTGRTSHRTRVALMTTINVTRTILEYWNEYLRDLARVGPDHEWH
jgi:hypothetical protein